jgi:rhamnogalacturonyl hydrolase YesR
MLVGAAGCAAAREAGPAGKPQAAATTRPAGVTPAMATVTAAPGVPDAAVFDKAGIHAVMKRVADWQLAENTRKKRDANWIRAAFYTGVMATYDATADRKYLEAARKWSAEEGHWRVMGGSTTQPATRPAKGRRFGDHQAIGQTYAELYLHDGKKDPAMIADLERVFDDTIARPAPGRVEWWWCDSLFMVPPVLTRLHAATGEAKYLKLLDDLFWDSHAFLYDKEEHLFYRDANFFDKRVDGKKMFWSRGNGWVVGGLARTLDYLPKDHPTRPKYEQLFKEMCGKLATLQGDDGLWRANLLVSSQFPNPETSGTAFFTFGMAWGINNGLLDRAKYEPVVRKGWAGLVRCVQPDGKLGYVQPVGADPRPTSADSTQEYGPGAFLLAGKEVAKMGIKK